MTRPHASIPPGHPAGESSSKQVRQGWKKNTVSNTAPAAMRSGPTHAVRLVDMF